MHYMFLIYSEELPEGMPPDEIEALRSAHRAVMTDAAAKGVLLGVDALQPTLTATSVRMTGQKAIITDGPFAETKEQLAGYYLLDCRDLDEAIEWAKRIPTQCKGRSGGVEIRPVANIPKPAAT